MVEIVEALTHLERLATQVPLELFTFAGSLIEELVAPIPTPIIMSTAGTIAATQNQALTYLFWLAFIAAIGKTIGCYFFYVLADKAEDVVVGKFGKFIGVSHKQIERIGSKFNGTKKDDLILFALRALPVIPSAPLSVICGTIKLNKRTYLVSSFFGNVLRGFFFLYLGYTGLSTAISGIEGTESVVTVIIAVAIALGIGYSYLHRHKHHRD